MEQETNDIYKDLVNDIEKVLDDYDLDKKDATATVTAIYLETFKAKLKPYHEILNILNKSKIFGHIGMIIDLLSDKKSIAKEEQQVKEKLKEIKKIFNSIDSSKEEKDDYLKKIFEDMFILLDNIYVLLSS